MPRTFCSTARATVPRSVPLTLHFTSIRREAPSRLISFGAGTSAISATSPSGTCVPSGVSIGNWVSSGDVVADLLHAPDEDVEDLLVAVDLADLGPLDQRGHRAADVAGGQPYPRGGLGADPDVELRHQDLLLDLEVGHPVDLTHHLRDLLRLVAQDAEVGAEDPHHHRRPRAGEHLLDPLLQVGQHVAGQAGIAVDRLLDRAHGLGVVGLGVDADPELGEVRARRPRRRPRRGRCASRSCGPRGSTGARCWPAG